MQGRIVSRWLCPIPTFYSILTSPFPPLFWQIFSLRPIDIEFMRRLHEKVNLIPVIAKSDTLTDEEITTFKKRVLDDIAHHSIQIFHAPIYDNEDEETVAENAEIVVSMSFEEKEGKFGRVDGKWKVER